MAIVKLNYLFIMLLTIIIDRSSTQQNEEDCVLPLELDYSVNLPLIFTSNGTLISRETPNAPDEEGGISVIVARNEEIVLSCAPNYFRNYPSEKTVRTRCGRDNNFLLGDEEKDILSELLCDARAIDEIIIKPHIAGCPGTARSIEYGYANPIKQKSYVLGEACYSSKIGRVLFAHTRLRTGNSSEIDSTALKVVKNGAYFRQEHPTPFYRNELMKATRAENYEEHFWQTFGSKSLLHIKSRPFINEYLLTHIQYMPITKLSWNYALLVTNGNGEELENFDKLQDDIASLKLKNVELYMGTHGIVQHKSEIEPNVGRLTNVYLKDKSKFPVPLYFWFVVKSENRAVAFLMLNRSTMIDDAAQHQKETSICASRCEEISWIARLLENSSYSRFENGYVLCCEFSEFRRAVSEMPELANVQGVLT